ncbi:MAG: hypothetical protein AAF564_19985 [Bacteroidota bacterium]
MTQLLQTAIGVVQKLSPENQDRIAQLMLSLAQGNRPLGLAKGMGNVHPDFNKTLPTEALQQWYGGALDDSE